MSSHIEYQRFRRGETCTEEGCRAKKFYVEDGKKFCQRGHEQFGFTQTQQDEDDWNAQGKKSRKKREEKERIQTVLSGREAKELYLQCYQLILWKQCHWLVSIKGFPPELETIVRDLWDLRTRHLQMMREKQSIYGSGTGTMMMFSSQSEGGTDHETDASGRRSVASRKSRKSAVTEEKLPKLVESLGLCYLGILLLRLPMSLGDLFKWAARDEMIYTRAIKEVPKDMRSKLPASYHGALEISAPFKQIALHRTTMELVDFFNKQFELTFPGPNISHLLAKHVRDLCLPVEIIPSVKRLASLLSISFTYPLHSPKNHKVIIYPEVQLICLIVIATKLSQPLGESKHLATSDSDLSAIKIDWKKWGSIMADEQTPGLKRGQEVHLKDGDVWGMTGLQIDEYLDWYQRTWIDDRDLKMPSQILDLFPLAPIQPAPEIPQNPETPISRIQAVHESMIWTEPSPHFEDAYGKRVERCGERYIRYRTAEELTDTAQAFYEVAASNAGVSLEMLIRGVFLLELQLDGWLRREKRKEAALAVEQKDMGSEDEEDW